MIVRLKVVAVDIASFLPRFQFYDSPIKSARLFNNIPKNPHFNSMIVRLKGNKPKKHTSKNVISIL